MEVCCADEREQARAGWGKSRRSEAGGSGTRCGASGAFLSELFGGIERAPMQVELSGVRILFELLGFLLMGIQSDYFCAAENDLPPDMFGRVRLQ
jgi:hypothetical protein